MERHLKTKQTLLANCTVEDREGDVGSVCRALLCEYVWHPPLLTLLNNVSHFHTETGRVFTEATCQRMRDAQERSVRACFIN